MYYFWGYICNTQKENSIMKTSNVTPTQKLIIKMLTENTGTHFLDSGFENGRMWQRNQGKNFISEPEVNIEFYEGDDTPLITVSTFHYLSGVLNLDPFAIKVNAMLKRKRIKGIDAHWVGECEDVLENYNEQIEWKGDQFNTYNYENNLSQILQGRVFIYDNTPYVLLQIHGGADVRGGYTDTQCFELKGYLTGNVDVYGSNDNGDQVDITYNGYSLTDENGNGVTMLESDNWQFNFQVHDEVYMYTE